MKQPFIILEHPSDLGIEAHGTTMSEAFRNAARGLLSIILDPETVREAESVAIAVNASDREQLLVRFLGEILYRFDGMEFVTKDIAFSSFSNTSLAAQLLGEKFNPARHKTRLDVKAVTYHQLKIAGKDGEAVVRVFVDI